MESKPGSEDDQAQNCASTQRVANREINRCQYLNYSNSVQPMQLARARSLSFHPPETSTATFKANSKQTYCRKRLFKSPAF
ncbi:hypothetical protein TNCV_1371711 [Trichonephila clavipes]|nr:hypothetical protein TNCV_1371711 [Trichonephila clavipes]